mmetsp:Transcript_10648/g.26715  ORF Transcript_10648/g.26715 Transcript_10648/m.26715 type:complete len:119 (-) Transcript_10648:196-552(-)
MAARGVRGGERGVMTAGEHADGDTFRLKLGNETAREGGGTPCRPPRLVMFEWRLVAPKAITGSPPAEKKSTVLLGHSLVLDANFCFLGKIVRGQYERRMKEVGTFWLRWKLFFVFQQA